MVTFTLFTLSGAALIIITVAKRVEEKKKKPVFILRAISRGDERARELHHRAVHLYSEGKEKAAFLIKKQLPMRSRNYFNKLVSLLQEQSERYMGTMRDSRLLKKSEGLSEFFQSMSEVEKGAGEIDEGYEGAPVQVVNEPEAPVLEREEEIVLTVSEIAPSVTEEAPIKPVRKARKAPAKRKVKLVVKED